MTCSVCRGMPEDSEYIYKLNSVGGYGLPELWVCGRCVVKPENFGLYLRVERVLHDSDKLDPDERERRVETRRAEFAKTGLTKNILMSDGKH